MPDLSNYYTKQEVDDKIIDASPIKTHLIEKECVLRLKENNGNNSASYVQNWYTEHSNLIPLSMKVKFKTIKAQPSIPRSEINVYLNEPVSDTNLSFNFTESSQEYTASLTDLPDVSITRDGTTLFIASMNNGDSYPIKYISGTITVIVDLTIIYIQ